MIAIPADPCFETARQRAALKLGPSGTIGAGVAAGGAGAAISRPWDVPPPGFRPFDFTANIATPVGGTSQVVLSFTVPFGWDGVIKRITNRFIGPGFNEGSGDLVWTIRVDGQAVPNYGQILVTFGDVQNGREVAGGIVVTSQQLVEYVVTVALLFVPGVGTQVFCALTGYFYPRQ